MTALHFLVPGTPRPKGRHRYRILQRKGTTGTHRDHYYAMEYADPETMREEARVAAYCQRAMVEQNFRLVDTGAVALFVLAAFQIPKSCSKAEVARRMWHTQRLDIDNAVKLVSDSMNGIAWTDDSQIVAVNAAKAWSTSEEFVEVWVLPLDGASEHFAEAWAAYKAMRDVLDERWSRVMLAGRAHQLGLVEGRAP